MFDLEEILKGELRCSRNINASLLFETLEKILKEFQNPAASLDLILTEQLQTKQVCWGHCLINRPNSGTYDEKIPGGFHAVRYQFYKATMFSQYKQPCWTTN